MTKEDVVVVAMANYKHNRQRSCFCDFCGSYMEGWPGREEKHKDDCPVIYARELRTQSKPKE